MNKQLAAAILLLTTSSANAGVFINPPSSGPVVIYNDGGGVVTSHQDAVYKYNYQHRRVEIRGSCRSACTLALAVNNVCVAPGAVLKWHHAYNPVTGDPVYSVTEEMLSMTPAKIRRVVEPHIGINYNPKATLTYTDLINLGVKDCDSNPVASDTQSVAYAPNNTVSNQPTPKPKRIKKAPARNVVENFFGSLF